jgi:large subunit ribosomal protein L31
MKEGIHPEYKDATITCVCGNVIETRSTKKDIKIEICSNCHPFMTGKQKIMDTAGRVERFKKRYAPKAEIPKTAKIEKTETTVKKTTKKASA